MTVGELEDRMSVAELARWSEFEKLEPFPSFRIDLGAGMIASIVANVNRGKNVRPFEVTEFMPVYQNLMRLAEVAKRQELEMPEPADEYDARLQHAVLMLGGYVVG